MKRDELIYKIVQSLNDNGVLDVGNYSDTAEQCQDVHDVISKVLDGVVLINGSVIE